MAKIPIYTRTQSLTTQAPNIETNAASYGAVSGAKATAWGQVAQAGQQITNTANALYAKFEDARDYQQELDYKVKKTELFQAQLSRAAEDINNTGDITSYANDFSKSKSELLKGITSPELKAKLSADYDVSVLQTLPDIQSTFRKNGAKIADATLDLRDKQLTEAYVAAQTDAEREDIIKNWDNEYAGAVASNNMYKEVAELKKQKAIEGAKFTRWLAAYQDNPTEAAKNADKYGLSIEDLQKATRISKETEKIVNENRAVNLGKATEAALNFLIDEDAVDALVEADKLNPGTGIKEKDAPTLRKAVLRGMYHQVGELSATNEAAGAYIESARKVFATKPDNRTEAYKTILEMYSDNYADAEELKFLNKLTSSQEKIDKLNKKKVWFWTDKKRRDKENEKEIANELHSLLEFMRNGKTFDAAAQEVDKESLITKNPSLVSYKKGRLGIDNATGIKYRYFPDGSREKVD